MDHPDPRDYQSWIAPTSQTPRPDNQPALQAAIDDAKANNVVAQLPPGLVCSSGALDLTDNNLPGGSFGLRGNGAGWGGTHILFTETLDVGLDCTGAQGLILEGFGFGTDVAGQPSVSLNRGLWMSASANRPFDMPTVRDMYISGSFVFATIELFALASGFMKGVKAYNYREDNSVVLRTGGVNRYGFASAFTTVAAPQSPEFANVGNLTLDCCEFHDMTPIDKSYSTALFFDGWSLSIIIRGGNISQRGGSSAYIQTWAEAGSQCGPIILDCPSIYTDVGPAPAHLINGAGPSGPNAQVIIKQGTPYQITGASTTGRVDLIAA